MSNTPFTREEQYLSAIANGETNVPEPFTREEQYLYEIATNGTGGASSASDVSYNNTSSGLTADNVQNAIDEVAQSGGGGITYDIIVSGTSTSGDEPTSTNLEDATYEFNNTMNNMLRKVMDRGMLDVSGILHWTSDGIVKYIPLTTANHLISIIPQAVAEQLAPGLTDKDVIEVTISCMTKKANLAYFTFYIYEDKTDNTVKKLVM